MNEVMQVVIGVCFALMFLSVALTMVCLAIFIIKGSKK